MVIRQGDVFWVELDEPIGSEPAHRRPLVIVQNDALNSSRLRTVVCCALTSNLSRAAIAGNVLLEVGEANLPKPSVVVVTQIYTADKRELLEKIGALSPARLREVIRGVAQVIEPLQASDEIDISDSY